METCPEVEITRKCYKRFTPFDQPGSTHGFCQREPFANAMIAFERKFRWWAPSYVIVTRLFDDGREWDLRLLDDGQLEIKAPDKVGFIRLKDNETFVHGDLQVSYELEHKAHRKHRWRLVLRNPQADVTQLGRVYRGEVHYSIYPRGVSCTGAQSAVRVATLQPVIEDNTPFPLGQRL